MMDETSDQLTGRRILLVEDDYFIAEDMVHILEAGHAEVVGPAASVGGALDLIAAERLDGAVLDINLHGEMVYPVADALIARGVPFVFATGYDSSAISPAYVNQPHCEKPVDRKLLARLIAEKDSPEPSREERAGKPVETPVKV